MLYSLFPYSSYLLAVAIGICLTSGWSVALLTTDIRHDRTRTVNWRDYGLVLTAGLGVWSTHFSAMMAYRPDLILTYDPGVTAASALVSIVFVGLPIAVLARTHQQRIKIALAALAGIGIWCMHAVGLTALKDCSHSFSGLTNAIGALLGTGLLICWQTLRKPQFPRVTIALFFVGAICSIHFIGIAGDLFIAPSASIQGGAMSPGLIATCMAFAVSIACLVGVLSASQNRQRRDREAKTLKSIIESISDGLVFIDKSGRLREYNKRFTDLFDTPGNALTIGMDIDQFLDVVAHYRGWTTDKRTLVGNAMKAWAVACNDFDHECEMEDGRTYIMQCRPVSDQGVAITFNDVTAEMQARHDLTFHAFHDALTGLGNRHALSHKIKAKIEENEEFTLFLIDLDEFKKINDSLGHGIGDRLLVHCAKVLNDMVDDRSYVARMGGDEMAVITPLTLDKAIDFAHTVVARMGEPAMIEGYRLLPGCSIGVAQWSSELSDEELMKRADMALYDAKQSGRRRAHCYENGLAELLLERQSIVEGLHDAIRSGGFRLAFQPIVDLGSSALSGYEALLRWHHPDRGWIAPDIFIPIAEESGLIEDIGRWVIADACRQAAHWPAHLQVAINVSAVQLSSDSLLHQLTQAVVANQLSADRVEIEVTETALMRDPAAVAHRLDRIRALGFKISLDDFGTGQSSLSHLRDLHFDRIKIDRSFVLMAATDPRSMAVLRATVAIGRELGVITHAEGVETPEQIELLRTIGCDAIQGYHIGRPVIPDTDLFVPPCKYQMENLAA